MGTKVSDNNLVGDFLNLDDKDVSIGNSNKNMDGSVNVLGSVFLNQEFSKKQKYLTIAKKLNWVDYNLFAMATRGLILKWMLFAIVFVLVSIVFCVLDFKYSGNISALLFLSSASFVLLAVSMFYIFRQGKRDQLVALKLFNDTVKSLSVDGFKGDGEDGSFNGLVLAVYLVAICNLDRIGGGKVFLEQYELSNGVKKEQMDAQLLTALGQAKMFFNNCKNRDYICKNYNQDVSYGDLGKRESSFNLAKVITKMALANFLTYRSVAEADALDLVFYKYLEKFYSKN